MGVQFDQLSRLMAPHLGEYWSRIRDEYATCSEQAPIVPQVEDLAARGGLRETRIELSSKPSLPRVFFTHRENNWLIQVQRDRFLHNWRATTENQTYPRFEATNSRFLQQWKTFESFVNTNELGPIKINQLEITYLNRIGPVEEGAGLGNVFPDCRWRTGERFLSQPETESLFLTFRKQNQSRRLRVTIKPAVDGSFVLDLTVRGPREEGLERWFAGSREWIVRAFADLTSAKWHERWGRTQ